MELFYFHTHNNTKTFLPCHSPPPLVMHTWEQIFETRLIHFLNLGERTCNLPLSLSSLPSELTLSLASLRLFVCLFVCLLWMAAVLFILQRLFKRGHIPLYTVALKQAFATLPAEFFAPQTVALRRLETSCALEGYWGGTLTPMQTEQLSLQKRLKWSHTILEFDSL